MVFKHQFIFYTFMVLNHQILKSMKRNLIIATLFAVAICSQAQSIKYKKDVQPLIDAKDYSVNAKNTALKFHQQNAKADGSLTEKAIMMSWDNMYSTRHYLGLCYYSLGGEQSNVSLLDSSIFFFKLAHDMKVLDHTTEIRTVQNYKEKVIAKNKNLEAAEKKKKEEDEYQKIYGEKTIVGFNLSGEFVGYCLFRCVDTSGNEYYFFNQNLGSMMEEGCRIKSIYAKDTFIIKYKLGKIELAGENDEGGSVLQTVEKDLITDIQFANPNRATELNNQFMAQCKATIDSLSIELKKYESFDPISVKQSLDGVAYATDNEKCKRTVASMKSTLERIKETKAKSEAMEAEQKKLTASGCNSCIISVTKKFLQACVDVDGPNIKANISKCCYDAKAECSHIGNHRPFKYSKFMEKPEINSAQNILDKADRFAVYYYSETMAATIVKPSETGSSGRARTVFVVKESGSWKVIEVDDVSDYLILNYISKTK